MAGGVSPFATVLFEKLAKYEHALLTTVVADLDIET